MTMLSYCCIKGLRLKNLSISICILVVFFRRFLWLSLTPLRNKKPNRKAKWHLTPYHAGTPMERGVHLDFLGPLSATKDDNMYIHVMVDQFTKWVECVPLPSQNAETTARAVINQFFSRFGFLYQIFTDRGTNFESNLFKQLCERPRIHKIRTTGFRPSANGQVERFNRTLMDAIRCFASRTPSEWDEYLPQLASAKIIRQ
jgi:transposase InsO family protein